jgi:hypothetical protein
VSGIATSAPPRERSLVKHALILLAVTLLGLFLWGFAQKADAAVYYANGTRIGRANNDGTGKVTSFISGISRAAGIAVNEEYVYWGTVNSTAGAGKIYREKLNGGSVEVLIEGGTNIQAIALSGTYIYWGNVGTNTIGRAKLDGTEKNQSFITGATSPGGLAVDSEHIYWSTGSGKSIGRANIDGTGVTAKFITDNEEPLGVAVDGGHIYWANFYNATGSSIGRANLDGTGVTQKFITTAEAPRSVSVDAGHIYWSNFGFLSGTSYGRAKIDGTEVNQSFITGASEPFGLATDARRGTTTTVACEPGVVGAAKSCTATVKDTEAGGTPATPTGTVTFKSTGTGTFGENGTCTLAAGTATGEASCSLTYTPAALGTGKETITATYSGGPTSNSGSGTGEVTIAVPATETTVDCTPNPVIVETAVSCATKVTYTESGATGNPSGTVSFSTSGTGGAFENETCTLAAGAAGEANCAVNYTPAEVGSGKETITATFAGGTTAGPSSGTMELTIAAATSVTATTVECTPEPTFIKSSASCKATVTGVSGAPAVPAGTVKFTTSGTGTFAGAATGTCTLVPTMGESAACSVNFTPEAVGTGKETITAEYEGSTESDPSEGMTELSVALPTTTTTIACSPTSVYTNVATTCAATVTAVSGTATGVPTGELTFSSDKEGTFEAGSFPSGKKCTLVAEGTEKASCHVTYENNVFGNRTITATYPGDSGHAGSNQHTSVEIMMVHKTKSTLTCATEAPVAGVPDACTFTVTDAELAGTAAPWEGPEEGTILLSQNVTPTAPTGTVTFSAEGGTFDATTCTVAPAGGSSSSCTVNFTGAAKGIVSLSASFEGAPAYLPTSASAVLKVVAAPVTTPPLVCQPGFEAVGNPPVCKEPTKPVTPEPPATKSFSKGRPSSNTKNGTATLPVYLPGPGKVVVQGKGVVKVTRNVNAAGQVKIVVKPTGSARKALNKKGHVSVKVTVTFTPKGGKPKTLKVPVRLVKSAGGKGGKH